MWQNASVNAIFQTQNEGHSFLTVMFLDTAKTVIPKCVTLKDDKAYMKALLKLGEFFSYGAKIKHEGHEHFSMLSLAVMTSLSICYKEMAVGYDLLSTCDKYGQVLELTILPMPQWVNKIKSNIRRLCCLIDISYVHCTFHFHKISFIFLVCDWCISLSNLTH